MSNKPIYALLVISLFTLGVVLAANIATQHTTGDITIVNGTNAGISVSPSVLHFGNVTWGSTVTKPILVTNTGDCIENIVVNATQPSTIPVSAFIPNVVPGRVVTVDATYDTRVFSSPGTYIFGLDWSATCV